MRNKVVVLFFILIASCQSFSIYENNNTYEKIGFAEFTKNEDVIHRNIAPNSKIKITNLLNKKSIVVEVNKNSNYKNIKMNQCTNRPKRIKERYIGDAIDLVTRWRLNYETRFRQENGKIVKLSLDQAAEVVGVPRKTLEDYYY